MTTNYDIIIIGGGHNGLVTAAYLAKAGYKVLVLEQRDVLGGAAATEEIWPGFRVDTGAHDVGLFQETIIKELFLEMQGLEFRQSPVAVFAPQPDGRSLTIWRDETKNKVEIAHFSQRDAERYPAFVAQVNGAAQILQNLMLQKPPDLMALGFGDAGWGKIGWQLKQLGDQEMMTFMRILPLAAQEYLDDWFESDALKGVLGADGITGNQLGPRGAGTTLMMLYQHSNGFMNGRYILGGIGKLSDALAEMAGHERAEIRVGTAVSQIQVDDEGQVVGVILADNTELKARVIISNADPRRTFFGLVGPQKLEPRFMRAVRNIIYRGCTAKVNLALTGLPQFNGQIDEAQLTGRIRIAPSLDYLEHAYDDAKYGRVSTNPYLDITIPTLTDPTLAPAGHHILSITMQYAPYQLRDKHWDEERERLGDLIMHTLSQYAPNLPSLIANRHILTPLDWEQQYGLTEGSIHHGQMGLEQLLVMRPVAGWGQYATPIKNLYLCGAGTHPGGGVTGAPGYNAAQIVLSALKK